MKTSQKSSDTRVPKPPKPPEKPLMPYMRYSRKVWESVKNSNPHLKLWEVGKIIGQMWRELPENEKSHFVEEYETEKMQYNDALRLYHNSAAYKNWLSHKERMEKNHDEEIVDTSFQIKQKDRFHKETNLMEARESYILEDNDEDPDEIFTIKHVASHRYQRNQKLMLELFSDIKLPQLGMLVTESRINALTSQVDGLTNHKRKLDEEINEFETAHQLKKTKIKSESDKFWNEYRLELSSRPVITEKMFTDMVKKAREDIIREEKERDNALRSKIQAMENTLISSPESTKTNEDTSKGLISKSPISRSIEQIQKSLMIDEMRASQKKSNDLSTNKSAFDIDSKHSHLKNLVEFSCNPDKDIKSIKTESSTILQPMTTKQPPNESSPCPSNISSNSKAPVLSPAEPDPDLLISSHQLQLQQQQQQHQQLTSSSAVAAALELPAITNTKNASSIYSNYMTKEFGKDRNNTTSTLSRSKQHLESGKKSAVKKPRAKPSGGGGRAKQGSSGAGSSHGGGTSSTARSLPNSTELEASNTTATTTPGGGTPDSLAANISSGGSSGSSAGGGGGASSNSSGSAGSNSTLQACTPNSHLPTATTAPSTASSAASVSNVQLPTSGITSTSLPSSTQHHHPTNNENPYPSGMPPTSGGMYFPHPHYPPYHPHSMMQTRIPYNAGPPPPTGPYQQPPPPGYAQHHPQHHLQQQHHQHQSYYAAAAAAAQMNHQSPYRPMHTHADLAAMSQAYGSPKPPAMQHHPGFYPGSGYPGPTPSAGLGGYPGGMPPQHYPPPQGTYTQGPNSMSVLHHPLSTGNMTTTTSSTTTPSTAPVTAAEYKDNPSTASSNINNPSDTTPPTTSSTSLMPPASSSSQSPMATSTSMPVPTTTSTPPNVMYPPVMPPTPAQYPGLPYTNNVAPPPPGQYPHHPSHYFYYPPPHPSMIPPNAPSASHHHPQQQQDYSTYYQQHYNSTQQHNPVSMVPASLPSNANNLTSVPSNPDKSNSDSNNKPLPTTE